MDEHWILHRTVPVMRRTFVMEVRVSEKERQTFRKLADRAGLSLSSWVRERLHRAARLELRDWPEKVKQR
jgi:hypothetical protein